MVRPLYENTIPVEWFKLYEPIDWYDIINEIEKSKMRNSSVWGVVNYLLLSAAHVTPLGLEKNIGDYLNDDEFITLLVNSRSLMSRVMEYEDDVLAYTMDQRSVSRGHEAQMLMIVGVVVAAFDLAIIFYSYYQNERAIVILSKTFEYLPKTTVAKLMKFLDPTQKKSSGETVSRPDVLSHLRVKGSRRNWFLIITVMLLLIICFFALMNPDHLPRIEDPQPHIADSVRPCGSPRCELVLVSAR